MVAFFVDLARFEQFTGRADKKILFGVVNKFLGLENALAAPLAAMAFIKCLEVRRNLTITAGEKIINGAVFAVADSKYGTIDNFLTCCDRQIAPHFEALDKSHRGKGRRKGIFEPKAFVYNPEEDLFICPAGELLEARKIRKKRNHVEYAAAAKICNPCPLKPRCTRSKQGRTLKRHLRQDELDQMLAASKSMSSRRDIKKRQHLMERSFAQASRYGFDRARWRRLWRVQIQEYLVAAVQNIRILATHFKDQRKSKAMRVAVPHTSRHIQTNATSGGLFERLLGHLRKAYSNQEQFRLRVAVFV